MSIFLILGGWLGFWAFHRWRWRVCLKRAAAELNLQLHFHGFTLWTGARGNYAGVPLLVEHEKKGFGWLKRSFFKIEAQSAVQESFKLSAEGVGSAFKRLVNAQELELGDTLFDNSNYLEGDDLEILATLSYSARQHLEKVMQNRGGVENGITKAFLQSSRFKLWFTNQAHADEIVSLANHVALAAQQMVYPEAETFDRLVENILTERVSEVRHNTFKRLVAAAPEHPRLHRAAMALIQDPSPRVRILGALHLGSAGVDTLRKLALNASDDPKLQDEAVAGLAAIEEARSTLEDVLQQLLSSSRPLEVALSLRRSAVVGLKLPSDVLLGHLRASDEGILKALPGALVNCSDQECEEALLTLLSHSSDEVATEAAKVLKTHGGRLSVMPLRSRADGVFRSAQLKHAVEEALKHIRQRLGVHEAGGLSIAQPSTQGGLSLEDEPGSV